ncbi:MAG: hypothetical protein K2X35_12525 [Bryobacteraceae bacterium]|nr:hypothetical protein [Bryobacteraceae bacterium]
MSGIFRLIFWDFPRASWQYDVVVALILAFIFLTPRDFFKDQPRASSVVLLPASHGNAVYWIEPDLLSSLPPEQQTQKAANLLRSRTKNEVKLVRLEPIFDAEEEIRGYMAYTSNQP